MHPTERRLVRVERELRIYRVIGLLLLTLTAYTFVVGWSGPPTRLDVNELNVVDAAGGNGRVSIAIGESGPGQPSLRFFDSQGRLRALVAVRGDGSGNRASTIEVLTDNGERIWWAPFGPSWYQ
ncbi:MAG: hypothetical protein U0821_26070 [Chloroflexota bacterium]